MKYSSESIVILLVNAILTSAYRSYEEFYRDLALKKGPTTSMLVNVIWSESERKTNDDLIGKKCYDDVIEFRKGVQRGENWALKMLDASAHAQSGYLEGNLYNYGNYKECIDIYNSTNGIRGQHCRVEFSLESRMRAIKNEKYTAIYHKTTMGICLPTSCDNGQATFLLKSQLKDFIIPECTTKSSLEVKIQPHQYYIMSALGVIAVLITLGTIYDLFIKDNCCYKRMFREKIFETPLQLSIRVNGETLFREDENKKSIKCIHGLRFISACGIVVVHRNLMDKQPLTNYFEFDKEITKWYHTFVINAYLFVDVFFLMSGLLVSYIFLNKINNKRWFNPLTLFLHRYVRLTPPLGVVIMIMFLFNVFCNGYYCNYESYHQENCEKYWYYTLLYINNLVSISSKCLSHSWYLTADMQLFVLSFIILFIIINTQSLKYVFTILTVLLIMNISTVFYLSYKYKLKSVPIGKNDFLAMEAAFVYEPFYTRAGPYIIGLGLGTILDHHNKHHFKMNKGFVVLGWIMAIICIVSASLGMYPFVQYDFQHNQIIEYVYKSVYRNVWALGFSWIIYACYTGNGGFVNTFLSCRAFQPLSKLTYTLYLIHPLVQEALFQDLTDPREFTDKSQISIYVGDVFYSLIMALILHLAVEAPTLGLERLYTRPNESARISRLKSNQSDMTTIEVET